MRLPPMRLPTWDEIVNVDEQRDVVEHRLDESLFVVGPPGSGKTILAMYRAKMAGTLGGDEAQPPVVIVTYNRMLRRRLDLMQEGEVKASTMHGFVWNDYRRRTNEAPPTLPHDSYAHDWESMIPHLEEAEELPNRRHLVVDEGQDLPPGFFEYAARFVSDALSVFSDEDQALSVQGTTLEQIKAAADLDDPVILTHNHRNTPEIALLAEHFHTGRLPAAAVVRTSLGELPRLVRSSTLERTAELVSNWSKNRGGSIGIIVGRNDTGRTAHGMLIERLPGRRVDLYDSRAPNEDSIEMLEPGVTILNRESVKGQEFDTVFLLDLERFLPCVNDAERRAMYMMCTRAKDSLFLVYSSLSARAVAALPGDAVLERS